MSKHGKKYNKAMEHITSSEPLPVNQALQKIKELAFAKFDESVGAAELAPDARMHAVANFLLLDLPNHLAPPAAVLPTFLRSNSPV